jgi:hypothetical protein
MLGSISFVKVVPKSELIAVMHQSPTVILVMNPKIQPTPRHKKGPRIAMITSVIKDTIAAFCCSSVIVMFVFFIETLL